MKTEPRCIVAPSVLSADFAHVADALGIIEETSSQWIHLDVMDGTFVPNITFGAKFIEDMRPLSSLIFDTHLMVDKPERHIQAFAQAGSDIITVHSEATTHLHRVIASIHDEGKQAGVSIVPSTPVSAIDLILEDVELVLIMCVNPGFGGQKFIPASMRKIAELAALRKKYNLDFRIAVDGGVNARNAGALVQAGVDVLVMGSAFFSSEDKRSLVAQVQGLDS
ncbi:MAG: ribulose-phosphate 3-epimerase [Sphaerochaetaceae bacterium]|jgi:ribulose-phosphate 3-epimerase|nr:ribulose-phosphate 3-epimerase [Sphaerochaetaceae bacterium]